MSIVGQSVTVRLPDYYAETYVVRKVGLGKALITPADRDYGVWIPERSVPHFFADVTGSLPPSIPVGVHPLIDAIIDGEATVLGKGDDGVVWRLGEFVIKGSTMVPFQFMNHHRTPEQAMEMMERQWRIAQKLRKAGVPHIPETKLYRAGDKMFEVKPYYTVVTKPSKRQLDQIADTVSEMLRLGYVVGDTIQVGADASSNVWFYDLGKIRKAQKDKSLPYFSDDNTVVNDLRQLYKDNGYQFEPSGYLLNIMWHDVLKKRSCLHFTNSIVVENFETLSRLAIRARIPGVERDTAEMRRYIIDCQEKNDLRKRKVK